MKDKLLRELFRKERWEEAINDGVLKGIDKDLLTRMCTPEGRTEIYRLIKSGDYKILPAHEAEIPKDDGTMRTVYVNENMDRVILAIINNLFFEFCGEMVHPRCVSYRKGTGCGRVVQEVTHRINKTGGNIPHAAIGIKADLSKYFDSVPIRYIDETFDRVESITGKSAILDMVRDFYHVNLVFDMENNLVEKYTSLKQGCAVAAFLADSVLYDMDKKLSELDVYYVRYSDDILIVGKEWEKGYEILSECLYEKGLTLNPKKVETLYNNRWFKFLGFNIKGNLISLSKRRVKTFQKEIEKRTVKSKTRNVKSLVNNVHRYLYTGPEGYSWATGVLSVVNVKEDIDTLNAFVMDCIRGAALNRTRVGGLGSVTDRENISIIRGTGRNVRANRDKMEYIENYLPLGFMRNALITSKPAYETLVRQI